HIHAASDLRSPTSAACDGATTASLDEYRAFEETLEDLVRLNHSLLASLRVSHPSLESVVSITNECGLASKLTGAGGGGCALTLLPHFATADQIQAVKSALEVHGFDQYQTTVGGEGVWLTTLDEENTKATTTLISMRSFLELKDDQLVTLARSQTTKVQLAEKIKGGSGSSNGNNIGPAGATAVTSGIIVPSTAVPHF
ncbi:Mevalonate kinase, partial [Spiromyces aspiralis]